MVNMSYRQQPDITADSTKNYFVQEIPSKNFIYFLLLTFLQAIVYISQEKEK